MRERRLGIKILPTNLKPDFGDQADAFANELADTFAPAGQVGDRRPVMPPSPAGDRDDEGLAIRLDPGLVNLCPVGHGALGG